MNEATGSSVQPTIVVPLVVQLDLGRAFVGGYAILVSGELVSWGRVIPCNGGGPI